MNKKDLKNSLFVLSVITKRNMKIYLKDKLSVFFSLLAPLIILMLYILFLGRVQYDSIVNSLPEGTRLQENSLKAFLDSWMISGVLSVACITVSIGANSVMIRDKAQGCINDLYSSPIKKWNITLSYFIFNYIVTVIICLFVFCVCLIYLAISNHFYLSFLDIICTIAILLYSATLSTSMTVFITSFFKSESALSGFGGIVSAAIGFLIGAYMPISIFPKPIQYLIGFIPNSYSGALFRNVLMRGALNNLANDIPSEFISEMEKSFSLKMDMFNNEITIPVMIIIIAVSILLFAFINFAVILKRKKIKM